MRSSSILNIVVPIIALAGIGVSVAFATVGVTVCDITYCKGQFTCTVEQTSCCCKTFTPGVGYGTYTCKCVNPTACDGKDQSGSICQ